MTVVYRGVDLRHQPAPLPSGSVTLQVSSPPYWSAAGDYSPAGGREWGRGPLADYIADTLAVLAELRRISVPGGRLLWVIGDSRTGSGGAGGDHYNLDGHRRSHGLYRGSAADRSLAPRQWANVPHRVAIAVQDTPAVGWLHHSTIVWDKTTPKYVENGPGRADRLRRPPSQHETILVLTAGEPGPYSWPAPAETDVAGLLRDFRIPARTTALPHRVEVRPESPRDAGRAHRLLRLAGYAAARQPGVITVTGIDTGDVWRVPAARGRDGQSPHAAPSTVRFPDELVARAVLQFSRPGDTVADLMAGHGTTARVATALGRRGFAFDPFSGTADWPDAETTAA